WRSRTAEGLELNGGTRSGVVTLQGNTGSAESKELAERLARNTEGVRQVDNQLEVNAEAGTADKARDKADQAGAAISDAWISSKVKSSFLFNNSLDGLDISVDTKGGQVTLGGQVATSRSEEHTS